MIKKIAILGSTGSIGKTLLQIINKNKNKFRITLLTANTDYRTLIKQALKFKVPNLIIKDKNSYKKLIDLKHKNIRIYNDFDSFGKIFKKKNDYTMSSIVGLNGLYPTYKIIAYTKNIAIANKESLVCAWPIIQNELIKHKVNFIPVDSEHHSIWFALKNVNIRKIDEIYITASGGPLLNFPIKKFNNVSINQVIKHPNWNMGKKISIDSATMMNKVFEVIEAKNIFNIPLKKIKIITHPDSYVHALIKFNNGLIKIIAHDTTMKIPIFNSLYLDSEKNINTNNISLKKLNNLNFEKVKYNRFPMVKILDKISNKVTLFETLITFTNDYLVDLYLKNQIKFNQIAIKFFKIINNQKFLKYQKLKPKNISEITNLMQEVSILIKSKSV